MWIGPNVDLTTQYRMLRRVGTPYRALPNNIYAPGTVLKLAPLDSQSYIDNAAVIPTGITANQRLLVGVVAPWWPGFGGSVSPGIYTIAPGLRGTLGVDVVVAGYTDCLVDQSGAGAVTIVNETPLTPSLVTPGYVQGVGAATEGGPNGAPAIAMLPLTGIGSSITAGALVQAAAQFTVGTPLAGDTLNLNLQGPYTRENPGNPQFLNFQLQLTLATAVSTAIAAAAMRDFLNAQPTFSQFWVATSTAGTVTVTVNTLAAPFMVTGGNGLGANGLGMQFTIALSGSAAKQLLCNSNAFGGGSTVFSGSTTFSIGGTGYKGLLPSWVIA